MMELEKNRPQGHVIRDYVEFEYLRLQARWTRPMRIHLYRRINLRGKKRILDMGCSDGGVTMEIAERTKGVVIGIDRSSEAIEEARSRHSPQGHVIKDYADIANVEFRVGDITDRRFMRKNFKSNEFDAVITNFTLMWIPKPEVALKEAIRVLRKGGTFLATGEPDYGGRIDWPEELAQKEMWINAIMDISGDPFFGRKLKEFIVSQGFKGVEVGIMPSLWEGPAGDVDGDVSSSGELKIYLDSIREFFGRVAINETGFNIDRLINMERDALLTGKRLIFMPIFWGMGIK